MNLSLTRWLALALWGLLSACASGPQAHPDDPLEPLNRSVYKFNDAVDQAVLEPVAKTYQKITPSPVRQGIDNFFSNLEDGWTFVNSVLQFKAQAAAESLLRFAVNTTFGFGGVLDIASELRLEKHKEDFGKTLGHWGVGTGPYLVLPFLGPSNLRDSAAMVVDQKGDLEIEHVPTRNSVQALSVVNTRANLLGASRMVDQVALDKYSFIRDAYLQRRRQASQSEDAGGDLAPQPTDDLTDADTQTPDTPAALPASAGKAETENTTSGVQP